MRQYIIKCNIFFSQPALDPLDIAYTSDIIQEVTGHVYFDYSGVTGRWEPGWVAGCCGTPPTRVIARSEQRVIWEKFIDLSEILF